MAQQAVAVENSTPAQTRTGSLSARADAGMIAKAAIHHLNGDLVAALECLVSLDPELDTEDVLRARGFIQLELGKYPAAAESYASASKKEPGAAENWFQWGFCLYKLGNFADALTRFEKTASLGAPWIEVPLAESMCLLGLKQYPKAIEKTDECLRLNQSYVPALFTKAVALQLTWSLDEASDLYGQVLGHDPKCVQALMNLITLGLQQKKYDLVEQYSAKLLELQPDNTIALEGFAISSFAKEDYDAARQRYSRLTEIAPKQAEHWLNLGIALRKQSALPEALHSFTRAREVRPDSIHAHTHLAETRWKSGDLAGARECYQEAVTKWPDREELTLNLSHVLEELENIEAATRVCENFCRVKADKERVWFRLGYLQLKSGAAEASADSFARALQFRPVWPEAEVNLALACYTAGRYAHAEEVLVALLQREPDHLEASRGLATVALSQENDERALELHKKLLDLGEKSADIYYNCGVLSHKLNRPDDAVTFYREAIAVRKDFPEALLNLGHVLKAGGESDEARSCWIPALELNPELALTYFRRG
jgi:tetratricopeptide (TPR) repeat protein